MSRKRESPYFSRHDFKRRRPLLEPAEEQRPTTRPMPPSAVVVMGLPLDCSVLDLKSRFEIYGSISRIRIDRDAVGYITYRNKDSAEAAIAAGHDPSFGVTVNSKKVQVLWATDPLAMWREGVGKNKDSVSMSKLVRADVPLRRHGRSNKLASAIGNTKSSNDGSGTSVLEVPSRDGLPLGCSVLDLKDSANAAIAADPSFEVNGNFKKLPFVEEKKESEDRLWSWGAGTDGQLGTGRIQDEHLP